MILVTYVTITITQSCNIKKIMNIDCDHRDDLNEHEDAC